MKNQYLILLVTILLLIGGLFSLHVLKIINLRDLYYFSVCEKPLTYSIGKIDEQFHVTKNELQEATNEAATLWNTAMKKPIFRFDQEAKLTVNLSYDTRTGLSTQINELESELDAKKDSIDPSITEYKKRLANYDQKLDSLNAEIQSWNDKGGAPPEVFERLNREQQELKTEAAVLQEMANNLNQSTEQFNQNVSELNQKVDNFNDALSTRPEEGVYDPAKDTITVYFNNDREELVRTLAHELGHARGLEHVNNKDSIMYYQTNHSNTLSSEDISEITSVCRERTRLSVIEDRFRLLFELISEKLAHN